MANRVFETLAHWTSLSDDALDAEIAGIEGRRPDAQRRTHARRLFAQALDTPGGLKVQTIHAFCTRLLHQFPFEADVAARFEVLEDRTRSELIDRLRMGVLLEAAAKPDSDLGRALATAITVAADQTFAEAIDEAIAKHEELEAWIAHAGGVATAVAGLSHALGVAADETIESDRSRHLHPARMIATRNGPRRIAALGRAQERQGACRPPHGAASCQRQRAVKDIPGRSSARQKLEPRKNIVSKGSFARSNPRLVQRLIAETGRVMRTAASPPRGRNARAHRRARHHRARGDRALSRREEPARTARLRRPDRQGARAARRTARPMGALQARPRRRPRADRRGAGHQRPAMADRPEADRASSSSARARATSTVPSSPSVTRSSRSSRSRARSRNSSVR